MVSPPIWGCSPSKSPTVNGLYMGLILNTYSYVRPGMILQVDKYPKVSIVKGSFAGLTVYSRVCFGSPNHQFWDPMILMIICPDTQSPPSAFDQAYLQSISRKMGFMMATSRSSDSWWAFWPTKRPKKGIVYWRDSDSPTGVVSCFTLVPNPPGNGSISQVGKRKIIFKHTFGMAWLLVPWRGPCVSFRWWRTP